MEPVARLRLPHSCPGVLALGGFLKNTLCAVKGDQAFLSPVLGDLDNAAALRAFEDAAAAMRRDLALKPRLLAHDLHPDFYSTRWAQAQPESSLAVQHHHAHIAAVAAEHGIMGPLIGLALDGFGLGPGGQSWGGELLRVDGAAFRRLGHLHEVAQPGGDRAAREPWRMAAAWLARLGRRTEIATRFAAQPAAAHLAAVIAAGVHCPPTSSAGRLFDAACGLLGVHPVADFEGQAPMALEAMVRRPRALAGGWRLGDDGVLDFLPLMAALTGLEPEDGADLFHGTLIAAFADWAAWAAEREGVAQIALSGGCLFNRVLRDGLVTALTARKLQPLTPILASPGDPGLSLGQAWVAALVVEEAGL